MKKAVKWPIIFKICTRRYGTQKNAYFYTVKIFKTRRDMYAYHEEAWPGGVKPDYEAICKTYTIRRRDKKTKRWKATPEIGEILFHGDACRSGIVSHEMSHAALGWARKRGLNPMKINPRTSYAGPAEEKFCWVQGWLVAQFWAKYWKYTKAK